MLAAGRAAALGARVTLVEQNRSLGRKLIITGGGRCNVTSNLDDRHTLVARYGARAKGLHSPFARFMPAAMRRFLSERGLDTKVENEGRVFPVTDSAKSVRSVLESYLASGGVRVLTSTRVGALEARGDAIAAVELAEARRITPTAVILATGGISRPETGSTGDGLHWLERLGHRVRIPEPSLVPVAVREQWVTQLQGIALPDVRLNALLDGKRRHSATGKLLFTHFGLSGPLVLNLSQHISELAQGGPVVLEIDLYPSLDGGALGRELQARFDQSSRRKLRNALGELVPPRIANVVLERAGVDGETPCHSVSREARASIVTGLKALSLTFDSLLGHEKAVVSSGGLDPREIDFRTMASKRYRNLFVAGDVIDVDRRSGGYSLQLCWATGWVAGESAAALAADSPGGTDEDE